MVAEFASPQPLAAIANDLSHTEPHEQRNATSTQFVDRKQVISQLEALLEGDSLPQENQQDFWTAFQGLMDSLDEGIEADGNWADGNGAAIGDTPELRTGALRPLNPDISGDRGTFAMGQLLPFRARSVEPAFDPTPTWTEVMVAFGQEIKRIREAQNLSLDHIRLRTQVPLYHLQALEAGAVDQLPEEVFVRGFLKRICGQLGEEGQALLAQLPAPKQEQQEILAQWQQLGANSHGSQVVHLRSAHLYVGYATLLATAAGGLAWSFQETAQVHPAPNSPQPTAQKTGAKAKLNPAQRAMQLAFGLDMAQPEQSAPETNP